MCVYVCVSSTGTASLALACLLMGRFFVGCERDCTCFAAAENRLNLTHAQQFNIMNANMHIANNPGTFFN